MTLAIDVRGLRKTYRASGGGTVEALKGVDLQVGERELFGFVGVNGAGKSTLIKSLMGLLRPNGGEAYVLGHPAGSTAARACIGYLPEVSNYHEFLTAQELLGVHAVLAGVPASERKQRCDEALETVGLGARKGSRIADFSKGMKQRFGIAQAMVGNPPLLVLDELTSGLDPVAQRELKDIMTVLRGKGSTILFSSHHMSEVEAVCDRVAIIHRGRMRACGTLEQLLTQPHLAQVQLQVDEGLRSALESQFSFKLVEGACTVERARVHELYETVRKGGGEVISFQPFRKSLEDFYFETIRKADEEEGFAK